MKERVKKKQLGRLWKATAHSYIYCNGDVEFNPARKPMTGKSARRLVGTHYRVIDEYRCGWLYASRPQFKDDRKYVILAERRFDDRDEWLSIARVK